MTSFKILYKPKQWRLLEILKKRLKAVLLHKGNKYASVPVGHSFHLEKCYENLHLILNKRLYSDHKCAEEGDLEVISMLFCQ